MTQTFTMDWQQHYLKIAHLSAEKSKDSTKVGAVLVGKHGEVLLTAYNGPPKGVEDRPERFERPTKYLYASHAESNLISFAARVGVATEGMSVFVTHPPCAACTRTLIQAGIKAVYHDRGNLVGDWGYDMVAASAMRSEAGIRCFEVRLHK